MKKQLRLLAGVCFSLLPLSPTSAIEVTTLADELDDPAGGGEGVSLREAVRDVEADGTITFAEELSGGTVRLERGEIVLGRNVLIDASGLVAPMIVSGKGEYGHRVISILSGAAVELDNLVLTDGRHDYGGGIHCEGSLVGRNLTIIRNNYGDGHGGGVFVGQDGSVTMSDSLIYANDNEDAGGVFNGGEMLLERCTVAGNSACASGGILNGEP